MTNETLIAREARQMTRKEIILKAINKQITWLQAADILGISARHMRRLKTQYERFGYGGLRDYRAGRPYRRRIPLETIREFRNSHVLPPDNFSSERSFHGLKAVPVSLT